MAYSGRRTGAAFRLLVGALALASLASAPQAPALTPGELLVVGSEPDAIIRVDTRTGKQRLFAANSDPVNAASQLFTSPADVTVAPNGTIYVVDRTAFNGEGGVIAVDPRTGRQSLVSANKMPVNIADPLFSQPNGIAILPSGTILVTDRNAFGGPGGVIAVDPDTGAQSVYSSNLQAGNAGTQAFADLRGGILVRPGGRVVVSDTAAFGGGALVALSSAGVQSRFSSNDQGVNAASKHYVLPVGIARSGAGGIAVADQEAFGDGGVVGVDPVTGRQRLISSNFQAVNTATALYVDPFDIAHLPDGRIAVLDTHAFTGCSEGCGGVIAVHPGTGKQRVLSSNDLAVNTTSRHFAEPFGMALVPPRCRGRAATIYGSPAGERLRGTAGPDVIVGGGGPDRIIGLGGRDVICAGAGRDLLIGGRGRDALLGQRGADRVRGGAGADRLVGGPGPDRLAGGRGPDLLIGGPGRDRLRGGPGRDRERQ